ncbi:hypothetical protein Salmuc_01765 [Salipiger mucosus DSM 16094]|uniref:Uncharacterized protein n=1 Tax=Salipiger mucosus DSM 16094 TaxID=1123237 RepID=S9S1A4_9RHOB|nr:hypothetical protein Salmuc_01765 [Salipiger mucosus DSM 16094]
MQFRSEEAARKDAPAEDVYSKFAVKPACHGDVPRLADKMSIGDLVELQAVLVDASDPTTIYPWSYRHIASARETSSFLCMPEVLCSILYAPNRKDEAKKDFRIAIASPAEAETVTDVLGDLSRLKKFLGYKYGPLNGFVVRGKRGPGKKSLHGAACYRSLQDDEAGLSDEAVILNFLKRKSQVFAPYMSEDNPWEVIPLHIVNMATSGAHRLESVLKRHRFMTQQDGSHAEMEFAHANVVLDYARNAERPTCKYFSICRSKPIRIETGLPTRARPKKIKSTEDATVIKASHLFG